MNNGVVGLGSGSGGEPLVAGRFEVKRTKSGIWRFLLLTAVYLLSYSGTFHVIDEVSVATRTESLVKHGKVSTDRIR